MALYLGFYIFSGTESGLRRGIGTCAGNPRNLKTTRGKKEPYEGKESNMTNNLSLPARWTMWENFSNTIYDLAKHDEQEAKDLLFGMWKYASWGEEPDFGDNYYLKLAFNGARFNLDQSVKSCASGKRGGKRKAENAKDKPEGKETDMTNNDMKSVRKMTSAMGKLYRQTVVEDFDDDEVLPDWIYEEQAAYMDDDYERRRALLQDEIDAEPWLGAGE